ncbi:GLPGLI family protein, partial [Myroides ceti]
FLSDKKATEKIWKIEYKEISIYTPGFINEDKATLYISDDYSFCKTEFKESAYSAEDLMASDDSILVIDDDNFDESFNEIVVNRNEKTLTEYLFEDMVLKNKFAVEESLPEMKWELLEEKKRIGNYNCEKAKTVFRGRMYEVWYTPEIPLSSGPWKFNGLFTMYLFSLVLFQSIQKAL